MSQVAVLGAGAGGLASTVHLACAGHDVRLWNRSRTVLEPIMATGRVDGSGIVGQVTVKPRIVTDDLDEVLAGADVVVVALPALAHESLFDAIVGRRVQVPIVLNPGGSGGVLHLRARCLVAEASLPPVVELSTLTHVARAAHGTVHISGAAVSVWGGCLPGGEEALEWGIQLFPCVTPAVDVIQSSLTNVNLVLHPPGAVLAAAWVEATHGAFTFYVEGMTPAVARVAEALDEERRVVGHAYGHILAPLAAEMAMIGTVPSESANKDLLSAIRASEANSDISAPDSTRHRYYSEDIPFGLMSLVTLGQIAGCDLPTARALLALGRLIVGDDLFEKGRTADRLGLTGLDRSGVIEMVGHGVSLR